MNTDQKKCTKEKTSSELKLEILQYNSDNEHWSKEVYKVWGYVILLLLLFVVVVVTNVIVIIVVVANTVMWPNIPMQKSELLIFTQKVLLENFSFDYNLSYWNCC